MNEKDGASFVDPTRGIKLSLEDGAPQRLDVAVTQAGVDMRAAVTLKPGSDLPLLVAAAHESSASEEDRQRVARLPQRVEIAFRRIAGHIAASAEWLVNARKKYQPHLRSHAAQPAPSRAPFGAGYGQTACRTEGVYRRAGRRYRAHGSHRRGQPQNRLRVSGAAWAGMRSCVLSNQRW